MGSHRNGMGKESDTEFSLRRLRPRDVRKAMLLSDSESWNQTEADWLFLIENPQNICLGIFDNEALIGTVTAMNHDGISWIGMVLVDKNYRGRGVSKTLLSNVITEIGAGRSVKLDATPAGQKVYVKFGFTEAYEIQRMTVPSISSKKLKYPKDDSIRPIAPSDIANICAYDATAFGAYRNELIEFLFLNNRKKSFVVEKEGEIEGFVLGRRGSNYYHVGPLMASSLENAKLLILKVLHEPEFQPTLLDIVSDKKEFIECLKDLGFSKKRYFIRMNKNDNLASEQLGNQYLIAGPEYG